MGYTKEGQQQMTDSSKIELPAKAEGKGGARWNAKAISEALSLLEVKRPVCIRWSAGARTYGAHRIKHWRDYRTPENEFGAYHAITVSTYLSPEQASATLWHELTHAAQADAADTPTAFALDYKAEQRSKGYRNNKFEVEARETADTMNDELRLTR